MFKYNKLAERNVDEIKYHQVKQYALIKDI